jgi:hypothetical protein
MTLAHFDTILAFVMIITGVSLIITTLTQMVSALLGSRGTHLRWGLKTLLENIDPNLKKYAEEISEQVLQHSLASDSAFSKFQNDLTSRWRLASAIRQDELISILRLLANPPAGQTANSTSPDWVVALQKSFEELDPQAAKDVATVATEVKKLFPNDVDKAQKLLTPLLDSAASLPAKIDQWFDSVMDRSSQRFALYMRVWTIFFAVVVAFALQLDAFRLFTRLSSDSDVRSQVLASADALAKKAEKVEDQAAQVPLRAASENLSSVLTNQLILQIVPNPYPDPVYKDWAPNNRAFWGMLASAALLSLGAPFWFNILKTMSNLQPVLANKQQNESAADNAS